MNEPKSKAQQSYFPEVRAVTVDDLRYALKQGLSDFTRAPTYGLFFGGVYALGGLLLLAGVTVLDMHWLSYPLVIGFALIGPFVATGLYEVSRRLERGQNLNWSGVFGVIWEQQRRELGWMAFVTLFIFWVWVYQARTIFTVFFGSKGFASYDRFLEAIFTTTDGWTFLVVGHIVGAIISMVLFVLTVVSCPLLLEREVDFVTAMITSIRAVTGSPLVMLGWGLFVVLSVVLAAIPAFLGLLIVLPVLGHATWHLYRRAVVEEQSS
ncbi:MAG: DUF2189 domain-containing protein [Hyphomicrobiaceae bacterium]